MTQLDAEELYYKLTDLAQSILPTGDLAGSADELLCAAAEEMARDYNSHLCASCGLWSDEVDEPGQECSDCDNYERNVEQLAEVERELAETEQQAVALRAARNRLSRKVAVATASA
ncbi:hypothetical protein SEA_ALEEMILY_147 [Gordonia phage Aleemily]|uniref:Uncharacterized protein n=1 Tax=Gordonia phage Aleemily TaxID=2965181 RepID=A0A9E7TRW4_9CAUD|nr:hypothetical protein SEA_ALEEMILY_147 [Gordonia phage Aleemily]